MGFGLSHSWYKNTATPKRQVPAAQAATEQAAPAPAKRRGGGGKVIASHKKLPPNQCCKCGTKWRLASYGGVKHCPKGECFRQAKRIAMGEA